MQLYPFQPDGPVSQVWHGRKLNKDIPDNILTPMWAESPGRHFYVEEIACLRDGTYFVPTRWVQRRDGMWAMGRQIIKAPGVRFISVEFFLY